MNDYNIQAASLISGVTVHQIRVWEKRYQAVVPRRLGNNFRSYTKDDIKRLKLLGLLVKNGIAISRIATLHLDELHQQYESLGLSVRQPKIENHSDDNKNKLDFLMCFLNTNKIDILKHEVVKLQTLTSVTEVIIPLARKILLNPNLKEDKTQELLSVLIEQINSISDQARTSPALEI